METILISENEKLDALNDAFLEALKSHILSNTDEDFIKLRDAEEAYLAFREQPY